jgi:cytochrome c oxidase assembly factor CtaG
MSAGALRPGTAAPAVGSPPAADSVPEALLTIAFVVATCLLVALYGRGVQELRTRRGVAGRAMPAWRVASFAAGVLVILATQHGPVHELAEISLAGHMTQHMLLLLGAGPLLAAGAAGLPLRLAAPLSLRRRLGWRVAPALRWSRRSGAYAMIATGGQAVVLWFWHLPGPYVAAVDDPVAHAAEHLSFVTASWLFWAPVLGAPRHRAPAPVAMLMLVGTMLPASALGAVLTFARAPVYPVRVFGPDPLADQQLAGLLMWVPMDLVVLAVALTVFLSWLLRLDRADRPGHPARHAHAPADLDAKGVVR